MGVLAFASAAWLTGGMQGRSESDRELLDAAGLVGHLVGVGSVYAFLGEQRRRLFPDELFSDLFGSGRGRPSVPGDVVATVMVLQSLEGLSDREAVERLRVDLRWKVAAGLSLADEGFHPTVLTLWRNRLRASEAPERIFDAVRDVVDATGVLRGKTRRALDSTLLDDAVATQDTVTQLVSVIRRVRRAIPEAAGVEVSGHDYDDGAARPVCVWDDPDARNQLVTELVDDAVAVLDAVEGLELDEDRRRSVALLALIAGQDVEPDPDGREGAWRIAKRVAADRVVSIVDPESRHAHKSQSSYRDGYKAHIAVEPDTGLITAADLTAANTGDGPVGVGLLDGEEPGLEVLADSAYGSGSVRADLKAAGHTAVIKPLPLRRNPHLGADQFTRDDFTIDYQARTVTCPQGRTVPIPPGGNATFGKHCHSCPLRSRCTTAKRGKTFAVTQHDQLLAAARADWQNGHHIDDYRQHRPMVERTIAWLVANKNRRLRYRGIERNRHSLTTRAAAINLRRLINLGLHHGPQGWALT